MRGVLVLALLRRGVPVAYEVAKELKAPLDVFLVRKLRTNAGTRGNTMISPIQLSGAGCSAEVIGRNSLANEALHKKLNDEVREAVSEPEAVATGLPLARKNHGFYCQPWPS